MIIILLIIIKQILYFIEEEEIIFQKEIYLKEKTFIQGKIMMILIIV